LSCKNKHSDHDPAVFNEKYLLKKKKKKKNSSAKSTKLIFGVYQNFFSGCGGKSIAHL
jgi:hypothetical protein